MLQGFLGKHGRAPRMHLLFLELRSWVSTVFTATRNLHSGGTFERAGFWLILAP